MAQHSMKIIIKMKHGDHKDGKDHEGHEGGDHASREKMNGTLIPAMICPQTLGELLILNHRHSTWLWLY